MLGVQIDMQSLRTRMMAYTPSTSLISVNTPLGSVVVRHNTGGVLWARSREELEREVQLLRKYIAALEKNACTCKSSNVAVTLTDAAFVKSDIYQDTLEEDIVTATKGCV
jgi:hypothetical protein